MEPAADAADAANAADKADDVDKADKVDKVAADTDVPERVRRIFGDDKARPKVMRSYDAQVGWLNEPRSPVLTWQQVDSLIDRGKTSVELKWRFTRHRVSLLDLRNGKPRVNTKG